jgi:hypothetical protein
LRRGERAPAAARAGTVPLGPARAAAEALVQGSGGSRVSSTSIEGPLPEFGFEVMVSWAALNQSVFE